MTLREFLNVANILRGLDKREIEPVTDDQWLAFRGGDQIQFLRGADDDVADRIWRAVERRMA